MRSCALRAYRGDPLLSRAPHPVSRMYAITLFLRGINLGCDGGSTSSNAKGQGGKRYDVQRLMLEGDFVGVGETPEGLHLQMEKAREYTGK